ncbi:MAG: response regulator, partial [Ignavibacteria bacterium]
MNKKRILIAEDEAIIGMDLQDTLKDLGYDVPAIVDSVVEVINKTGELNPDVVLMDIALKGDKDGIEAAAEIKNKFGIPVIYTTAYSDELTTKNANMTEHSGFIYKPFDVNELVFAIEVTLFTNSFKNGSTGKNLWYETKAERTDAVIAINKKGSITFMNSFAESITGWSLNDAAGKDLMDVFKIITPDNVYEFNSSIPENNHNGCLSDNITVHTIFNHKSGEKTLVETNDLTVKNNNGELYG